MKYDLKIYVMFLMVFIVNNAYGQSMADTAQLADEFNKVLSFATKPYLYCTTETKMSAPPGLEIADTATHKGEFYKNQSSVYYDSGPEICYLQNSFLFQINHQRKCIWISKVDIASKEKMNVLNVNNKQVQDFLQKRYSIKRTLLNNTSARLDLVTTQKTTDASATTTKIELEYSLKDHLPTLMKMKISLQQLISDELSAAIQKENLNESKLVQTIGNKRYLFLEQAIDVSFISINNTKEKAMQIPVWTDILDYHAATKEFIAKGLYKNYEVTKTF